MLAIGRALMTCPKPLILDEPTEGLAPIVIELVVRALEQLRRPGVALLLMEQRVEVALRLAARGAVLGGGAAMRASNEVRARSRASQPTSSKSAPMTSY